MKKILVPQTWYKEMANELARNCMDSKLHVIDLQNRIELMKVGTPSAHDVKMKITIEQLLSWLEKAENQENARKKYNEFKAKYTPDKNIKGNLKEAKKEILTLIEKIMTVTSINSPYDPYHLIGVMDEKYFLSNKQIDSLMNFMSKRNLLY